MTDPRAAAVRSASALAAQVRTDMIGDEHFRTSWPQLERTLHTISEFTREDVAELDGTARQIAVACLEDLQIALERHELLDEAAAAAHASRALTGPEHHTGSPAGTGGSQAALAQSDAAVA